MQAFLMYWLRWPIVEDFFERWAWAWPLTETVHFVGLVLLIGAVGMFDLRLLGVARGLPIAPLRRLLPWGVLGFVLCVISGGMFVTGVFANLHVHPYYVLMNDGYLQLKLLFITFAGLNLFAFYATGMSRAVDSLPAGADAPRLAKAIAAASLCLWIGVMYFGRLVPWGQVTP
jgi:hypothetical protein